MELSTQDIGEVQKENFMECRLGPMVPSTRATGLTTWRMVKESSTMLMATFMMEIGSEIKLMGTVYTSTKMGQSTRGNGITICNTVRAKNNGLTEVYTMVITNKELNMAKENILGLMVATIVENG